MHYFHLDSPKTYLAISSTGQLDTFILGHDITKDHMLQKIAPGGYWKTSLLKQGAVGLLSEAISPEFDYSDMSIAKPSELRLLFPDLWHKISRYVKSQQ